MASLQRAFDVSRISHYFYMFFNLSKAWLDGCIPACILCITVEDKPIVSISSIQCHDLMAALRRAFDVSRISYFFYMFFNLSKAWLDGWTPAYIRFIAVEDKPVVFRFRTISLVHDWMAAIRRTSEVLLLRISQLLYTSYDLSINSIVIFIVLRLVHGWIFMV